MVKMDETNLHILQLLQRDGRMSLSDLSRAVGRSESTVRERVTALELDGILLGYEARVDWEKAGLKRLAIVRAGHSARPIAEVAKQLAAIPNVTQVLLLTGSKPLLVCLRVRDIQHLDTILKSRFAPGDLVDMEVQVALESLVDLRQPAILSVGALDSANAGTGSDWDRARVMVRE
jgi:Lrp/AsnC family leucine-responsive transcriptional regulator